MPHIIFFRVAALTSLKFGSARDCPLFQTVTSTLVSYTISAVDALYIMSHRKMNSDSVLSPILAAGVASCPEELLEAIFEFFDRDSLVSCTTVNRIFFDVATKQLWLKLESLRRLFSVLSPIVRNSRTNVRCACSTIDTTSNEIYMNVDDRKTNFLKFRD